MDNNHASYEESSFCINAERLSFKTIDKKNGARTISNEDMPAFIHEWWHYIQDISTISAQNGFYLWTRDFARLSQITCNGTKKTIHLPLDKDEFGEPFDKDRALFRIFCGQKEEYDLHDCKIEGVTIEQYPVAYSGTNINFAKCQVEINKKHYNFGLLALQELNAYYIQRITESFLPNVNFNVPASTLPTFPYHLGDMLFDYYNIHTDEKTKFIISMQCLDSIQAPAVFLNVLKKLMNSSINYVSDRSSLNEVIYQAMQESSCSNLDVNIEWVKDYKQWIEASSLTKEYRGALKWYIQQIYNCSFVKQNAEEIFPLIASGSLEELSKLYETFPAPLIKIGSEILGSQQTFGAVTKETFDTYNNALIIWTSRRVYDLLRAKSKDEINERARCVLCDGCKNKAKVGNPYLCSTSFFSIANGRKKVKCPMMFALANIGLWQNTIEVDI